MEVRRLRGVQAKRGRCKAAESVRGAGRVAEALAGGGGGTSGAPGVSISSTLPGVEEREEEEVTSALQVPGPSRSWDLAPAALLL